MASQATPTSAAELLRIREARWLRVPVIARFVFIGFGALSLFGSGLSPSMMILICVALGIVIGVNLYFLHLLRKVRRLELVGIGGVMLDALNMIAGPVIWYQILAQGNLPVAELVKTPFILAQITLIVINSLALRPLYPLILTAVGILVEGGILVLARADPTVVWAEDPALVFAGAASSVGLFIAHAIYLGIVGGALAFMTRGARRTFRDAVELEVEQARLLREQGEIVMEGRLVALGKLVAGLSHEINTPVAVLKSNATTIGSALKLIRGALPKTDPKMERVLDGLDKGSKGSIEASERVDATLQTLRSFARLDNAELGHSDLSADLDGVLELIPRETIGRTRVARDYGELPRIECFPRRLNQVFITLLTNAFDAIEDDGAVRVTTRNENGGVAIEIQDSGRGLSPDQLARIFDVHVGVTKGSRIGAGFGLAACYQIARDHRGTIEARSVVGQGTSFIMRLPLRQKVEPAIGGK